MTEETDVISPPRNSGGRGYRGRGYEGSWNSQVRTQLYVIHATKPEKGGHHKEGSEE